ncbi:gag-pol polyprotein [Cucumis melo var. makuwa]|uniref:Gag-pol polyprotein n=1 Tax=Cucumis melo var. makuwa TaxID=1194695 RepID=A0A5D3C9Q6_CUCMM|nr:gag-pol polyprotein [Cucumis melo var. makuwa]TYK07908.1 gag-pol polyprotein [Cucumis melo var. makuwa]
MLTNWTLKLDDILDQGMRVDDKRGLEFVERDTPVRKTVFIREGTLQNSPTNNEQGKENCKVALTSVKSPNSGDWYFDSGCSRHMTGNADFFSELSECKAGSVVFEDGGKGKIIGKGTINRPGLPFLLDVRLVQGLSANLISTSQLCDQGYKVNFSKDRCNVLDGQNKVFLSGTRLSDNCYHWDAEVTLCNLSKVEEAGLWHKRLGHLGGATISKVIKANAIIGLPPLSFSSLESCSECPAGKQVKSVHKPVNISLTSHILELLHIDLMRPMQTESLGRKRYAVVCVDDFSRYTWIKFILEKLETFKTCQTLVTQLQREKNTGIGRIRTEHGCEFENKHFAEFCDNEGIFHEFSAQLTPQENGVVEKRNQTLQEMARVMIHAKQLPIQFWAEALNTACHIHNRVILRPRTTTTSYELWKGRKPNVKYFHIFGGTCFILSDRDHRRKWDSKSDRGIFLGYSANNRAYRVYNQRTKIVIESINVIIDDLGKEPNRNLDDEDEVFWNSLSHKTAEGESESTTPTNETTYLPSHFDSNKIDMSTPSTSTNHSNTYESEAAVSASQHTPERTAGATDSPKNDLIPPMHIAKNHPFSFIIGDVHSGIITQKKERKDYAKMVANVCYTFSLEPTTISAVLTDEHLILAMQEELLQFERNQVWELVPKSPYANIIGTKWIFKNKTDEEGRVICNKARLVAQGYSQIEGNNIAAWFSKKQNSVSLSTAEAEYIAVGSSCSQLLWMKQMLDEYGITQSSMILYCDNLSAISISKNPVQHSQTKHINIQHHFIRELVEANIISLEHVQSAFQLADIFTKPLDVATFEGLRASVGVCQRPT